MRYGNPEPDPNIMRALYGPPVSNDPYEIVLSSLLARRHQLDLLIAQLEFERPKSAPLATSSLPSGESDPSVMLDYSGADTQPAPSVEASGLPDDRSAVDEQKAVR